MNFTIETGVLAVVALISIGQLAERFIGRLTSAPAPPTPAPPAPPAPPVERVATLPPQPAMVPPGLVVQATMAPPAPPAMVGPGPYREPHLSGDECTGCAVLRAQYAALAGQFQEFQREAARDRVVRDEIKAMLERAKGEKDARRQFALEQLAKQGKVVVDGRESGTG